MSLEFHPLCLTLPDMAKDAFAALVEDIRRNGQHRDIVLHEGMILDGRHRYRACLECGIEPRTTEFAGDNPVAFVVSENLARRHLTDSQRGLVAATLANLSHGQRPSPADLRDSAVTHAQAAELLGVSERMVQKASAVKRNGAARLVESVQAGKISLNEATRIASLGHKSQERIAQIENRKERHHETTKALNISNGRKRPPPVPRLDFVKAIEQPAWVQTTLGRLENLIQAIKDAQIEPTGFVQRLRSDANWNDERFCERFDRCRPWLGALADARELNRQGQEQERAA
ncbi:MAG: ParB/RepB/Spo0J family partition protein [Lysobacter sp.]